MPFGQSTPLSVPLGIAAGIVGGHYAGKFVEQRGGGELTQKVATALGHWAASSVAGYAINAVSGDVGIGVATTTGQAAIGGVIHGVSRSTSSQPASQPSLQLPQPIYYQPAHNPSSSSQLGHHSLAIPHPSPWSRFGQ